MAMFDDPILEEELLAAASGNVTPAVRRQLERRFRKNIVQQLQTSEGIVQSIESPTGIGIPDVYCSCQGLSFWLELKMCDRVLGSVQKLRFQKGQREWLLRNMRGGGNSLVGVHYLDGYAFVRGDVVACTGGAVPVGDKRFLGYIFTQSTLRMDDVIVWAKHAVTLPLLTDKLDKETVVLERRLLSENAKRRHSYYDEGNPATGGN